MKKKKDHPISVRINGCEYENSQYRCIHCPIFFEDGLVYPYEQQFEQAEHAIKRHISEVHQHPLMPLLELDKQQTGVSEIQMELLHYFAKGLTDKEIARRMNVTDSTIRNHRFKLREKERQAKSFLAIMSLLKTTNKNEPVWKGRMIDMDSRFAITEAQRKKVLENFIDQDGRVNQLPAKEKSKLILFQEIATHFSPERNYTEAEVNEVIKRVFSDYVTVRRYLIEYGFLGRTKDGQSYWLI